MRITFDVIAFKIVIPVASQRVVSLGSLVENRCIPLVFFFNFKLYLYLSFIYINFSGNQIKCV